MSQFKTTRIKHKHDIEANWIVSKIMPLDGEIIIYDPDDEHATPRFKVGDGETALNDLPFVTTGEGGGSMQGEIYTLAEKNKLRDLPKNNELTETLNSLEERIDNKKVDKVTGKGLSTNDFTNTEKEKLSGLLTLEELDKRYATVTVDIPLEKGTGINSIQMKGVNNKASGENAFAIGSNNIANENNSHVEGYCTETCIPLSYKIISQDESDGYLYNIDTDLSAINALNELEEGVEYFYNIYTNDSTTNEFVRLNGYITDKPTATQIKLDKSNLCNTYKLPLYMQITDSNGNVYGCKYDNIEMASHSEGGHTKSHLFAHAEGYKSEAIGPASHAEGLDNKAIGPASHAEGMNNIAFGDASHAGGNATAAMGRYSYTEGYCGTSLGHSAHSEGFSSRNVLQELGFTKDTDNMEIISKKIELAGSSFSLAKGDNSHVEGKNNLAIGISSHAEGGMTITIGKQSHATGLLNTAYGDNSYIEGQSDVSAFKSLPSLSSDSSYDDIKNAHNNSKFSLAFGSNSHVEGRSNIAFGLGSHVEGLYNTTKGNYSHIEGKENDSLGDYSHIEGYKNIVKHGYTHAEGYNNKIYEGAVYAHVEGRDQQTSGQYSHLEGRNNNVTASGVHAEGTNNTCKGDNSHVEGFSNTIEEKCIYSHAEGSNNIINSNRTHVEGANNISNHDYTHIEGRGHTSSRDYQHLQGKYSDQDESAVHILGWGTSDANRKNIHTIKENGDAWFAGNITVGVDNAKVLTEKDVDNGPKDKIQLIDQVTQETYELYISNGELKYNKV